MSPNSSIPLKSIDQELGEFFQDHRIGLTPGLLPLILSFLAKAPNWDTKKERATPLLSAVAKSIKKRPLFQDLMHKCLRIYEEAVPKILPEHRDHYVHSAYVYLIGLYLFRNHHTLYAAFKNVLSDNRPISDGRYKWKDSFDKRWAITALFHDIGYPFEIAANQMKSLLTEAYKERPFSAEVAMGFSLSPFKQATSFERLTFPNSHISSTRSRLRRSAGYLQAQNVFDLIGYNLAYKHTTASYKETRKALLDQFINRMKLGFIDHGLMGTLVLANWGQKLYRRHHWDPEHFYCEYADCLGAVTLHTAQTLPSSFCSRKISVHKHPLAYLLVLCDELHDWWRPKGEELHDCRAIMSSLDKFRFICKGDALFLDCGEESRTVKIIENIKKRLSKIDIRQMMRPRC